MKLPPTGQENINYLGQFVTALAAEKFQLQHKFAYLMHAMLLYSAA